MIRFRPVISGLFLSLALLAALLAPLQAADPPAERDSSTYVNEQFAAYEAIARVRALVGRAEWDRAAEGYDALFERYGDCLVKTDRAAASQSTSVRSESFVTLAHIMLAELAQGPAALIAAYQSRFDSVARQALARPSTRPSDATRVARRYFLTRPAATVLEQDADRRFESADFLSAARSYAQLADLHPEAARRGIAWRAKHALCLAWLGDNGPAEKLLAAPDEADEPAVNWAGQSQTPREFLRAQMALMPAPSSRPDKVRTTARSESVLAPPQIESSIFPEAPMWQFSAFSLMASPRSEDAEPSSEAEEIRRRALQSGAQLNMLPLVVAGRVIVSQRRRVWAVDPADIERAAWRFDLDSESAESTERGWSTQEEPPPLHTLAAAGDRVYAHLDRAEQENADPPQGGASTLVCLDARDGTLLWRRDMSVLGGPFDECRLDGAPLVAGDKLICIARRRKPFGFEACIAAAFDARLGALLWQTHLGEAASGGYGFHRPTRTYPAADDGRLFVHTNIGTIAAVDLEDGHVAWLVRYPSAYGQTNDAAPARGSGDVHPWHYAPTLLWRDRLVVAPMDRDDVLLLDQETGRTVDRIGPATLRDATMLLGIQGNHLFAAGGWVVCYDLAAQRAKWERQLPAGRLLGRGALAGDAVFVPTDAALLRYPVAGGAPVRLAWPITACGNVVPVNGQVVVAADQQLAGWVQKDAAFRILDERLAADPTSPAPALTLAELAFETEEISRGLAAVDEAVRRALAAGARLDTSFKARLFRLCMRQADRMTVMAAEQPELAATSTTSALALLDRAAACAPDVESEIAFRLKRGGVLASAGRHREAVNVCQQILSDPGLSQRLIEVDNRRVVAGGQAARYQIARLIETQGRAVYSEVEKAAADRLRQAAHPTDLGALRQVWQRYPNSAAATRALSLRADALFHQNEWAEAARDLRRAVACADGGTAPALRKSLVELLAKAGQSAAARHEIESAARRHPNARFDISGRSIGFSEWRRLFVPSPSIDSESPSFTLPLVRRFSRDLPSGASLIVPGHLAKNAPPPAEFLVWADDQLQCHASSDGKPLWPQPLKIPAKPTLLFVENRTAVLATPQRSMGVDLDRGVLVWSVGSSPEDAALPGMDPERLSHFIAHARAPGRYFGANDRGELMAIDVASGRNLWRVTTEPRIGTRMTADDRWVAYTTWNDRRNVLVLTDASSGRVARQIALAAERPIQRLVFADDGTLAALSTSSIHAIDPDAGRVLWSTPLDGPASMSSVAVTPDGIYLSTDNNTLARFEWTSGSPVGATPPLSNAANDSFTTIAVGDRVLVASPSTFFAIDAATGLSDWEAPGLHILECLRPSIRGGDLLAVTQPGANQADPATRYALVGIDLSTGLLRPVSAVATQPSERNLLPLDRVDAALLCRHSVLVLSGNILTGYAGEASPTGDKR